MLWAIHGLVFVLIMAIMVCIWAEDASSRDFMKFGVLALTIVSGLYTALIGYRAYNRNVRINQIEDKQSGSMKKPLLEGYKISDEDEAEAKGYFF